MRERERERECARQRHTDSERISHYVSLTPLALSRLLFLSHSLSLSLSISLSLSLPLPLPLSPIPCLSVGNLVKANTSENLKLGKCLEGGIFFFGGGTHQRIYRNFFFWGGTYQRIYGKKKLGFGKRRSKKIVCLSVGNLVEVNTSENYGKMAVA